MRIVIDLQGSQASNKNRGIGRYSLSFTKAILNNKKSHEVIIVLSDLFLDEVSLIKQELKNYLDESLIRVWSAPSHVSRIPQENTTRRKNAELLRETFIASLHPDMLLITSLFEGLVDDAVTSVGLCNYNVPTAVILYDLIPLIHASPYLDNPDVEQWYKEKIEHLKRADLLLSISESSKKEGIQYLNFDDSSIVNIGTASDEQFQNIKLSDEEIEDIYTRYNINKPFLMYTGGIDHRKNIEGLIRAYALLDKSIRVQHQLAIVCSMNEEQKSTLHTLVTSIGIKESEVVFTGYIPENDLISLYNLCKAFIFPSWHEGFGLPALEAMNCGAPVIVSNKSSLPEVVGLDEALFDPLDDEAMATKIEQILTNDAFRNKLLEHHKKQRKKFSWEHTAKKSIEAFETFHIKNKVKYNTKKYKPKLAYISPLPPQKSGISDYSAELLPFLSKYYDIEVIVTEDISDEWINQNCAKRDIDWFKENFYSYARVLYHFGNSHFHQHMFPLLKEYPGVVVLHDFYLSGIVNHMSVNQYDNVSYIEELYYSHGYKPFCSPKTDLFVDYPTNKRILNYAKGIIVHSKYSKRLAKEWYNNEFPNTWSYIPHLRINISKDEITHNKLKKRLKIPSDTFIVSSFGLLGKTKSNQKLLDAWLDSNLCKNPNNYLIFVGKNSDDEYGLSLEKNIKRSSFSSQIIITGWTDTNTFQSFLSVTDIAVQLRTMSRGETSGTVLDCMNHGIPTIINANGSMAELDDNAVFKLVDDFRSEDLVTALETLYKDKKRRKVLGKSAKEAIVTHHAPKKCAEEYFNTIEKFYTLVKNEKDGLLNALTTINIDSDDVQLEMLSKSIARNHEYSDKPKLFIDVSTLVQTDDKSGIQRVVKAILNELLHSSINYRIEPVYADKEEYKYANKFTFDFLSCNDIDITDSIIDFSAGDIFLGLDLSQEVVVSHHHYYKKLQAYGVKTYFIVYDILPILHPHWWPSHAEALHTKWLETVIDISDGLISISKSVSQEVKKWIRENDLQVAVKHSHFHLGADIDNSTPSKGLEKNSTILLGNINKRITFLMVGTLEPRKGHMQTLEAFEKLWTNGIDVNLVIVGKQGWLVDTLITKINNHPELNKRLFWLNGISDEYLEKVYENATCLIAASEGEGFGLPLIEAAQHKISIIARGTPVFREVAGEYAYYFTNDKSADILADTLKKWLKLYKKNTHPKSDEMPWLTWEESSEQLLNIIISS